MENSINVIIRHLPFAVIIFINVLANGARFYANPLKPYLVAASVILVLNLLIALRRKIVTYFMIGITSMVILGTVAVFLAAPAGSLFLENVIPSLYVALFCVAFFPPLLGLDPFTYEYSRKDYPSAVWSTRQFVVINLILNYVWVGIFIVTFGLSLIHYSDSSLYQQLLQNLLPIIVLLGIGYPLTKKLPSYLQQRMKSEPLVFRSVAEMFELMPYGLNRKKAEGVDAVVQFNLTGDEPMTGFLTKKDQACSYTEGIHENPTMVINAPSRVWLDMSNGDLDGAKAMLNGMYTVEGDASLLLIFNDLFTADVADPAAEPETPLRKKLNTEFAYGSFEPGHIRKILVIDGGSRNA